MTQVHAILACTDDHIVGKEDYIPWKMSADMKRFKELTSGHALLIGYRTFVGMIRHYVGKSKQFLPGRDVYVLADFSRCGGENKNQMQWNSFHDMIEAFKQDSGVDFSNIRFVNLQNFSACYPEEAYISNVKRTRKRFDEILNLKDGQILYIAGGVSVYERFMHVVETVEVTVVETRLKNTPKSAFNYDLSNSKLVELSNSVKKDLFSMNSPFKRELIGKISKDDKNEYNASYYQLIRSLDGSTPINVLQGTSAG